MQIDKANTVESTFVKIRNRIYVVEKIFNVLIFSNETLGQLEQNRSLDLMESSLGVRSFALASKTRNPYRNLGIPSLIYVEHFGGCSYRSTHRPILRRTTSPTLPGFEPGNCTAPPWVLVVAQGMATQSVVQLSPTTT